MGAKRLRKDSVKKLRENMDVTQLQAENEQLRKKVDKLEGQLVDTQMALCDVFELVAGGE